eukprot:TRINITY_DN5440_c0_g1_i1.p1 TRINITY_DN5440_c0_g1~~TRINITY_DN5440_c0_g1_i1.p1  ORF type:complete len:341 (+),score=90.82 TRINITY_DN5440_c0_g1_i1:53-1024(+)
MAVELLTSVVDLVFTSALLLPPHSELQERLLLLINRGEAHELRTVLSGAVVPQSVANRALREAVEWQRVDCARHLLTAANANANTQWKLSPLVPLGYPALWHAAGKGESTMLQLLISYGASLNACVPTHGTPLHHASERQDCDALKVLLSAGADVDVAEPRYGWTALARASAVGFTSGVRLLLAYNARADLKQRCGSTALMWAVAGNHGATVRSLLHSCGAEPHAINRDGHTALSLALRLGHRSIAGDILRHLLLELCLGLVALDLPVLVTLCIFEQTIGTELSNDDTDDGTALRLDEAYCVAAIVKHLDTLLWRWKLEKYRQ